MGTHSLLWCILLAPFCGSAALRLPESVAAPAAPAHEQSRDREHENPQAAPSSLQQHHFSHAHSKTPRSAISASGEPEDMPNQSHMTAIATPFIVSNATVRSPVSAKLQAALETEEQAPPHSAAGAFRALLMQGKKLKKWPKCSKCRITNCGRIRGKRYCHGHCRRKRKLWFCDTFRIAAPDDCESLPTLAEVEEEPADKLGEFDTAVVTAPAPYIGCADIGNRPPGSGCPAAGTKATIYRRSGNVRTHVRTYEVVSGVCRSDYYVPECRSPVLPFGVCECYYKVPARYAAGLRSARVFSRLCKTTELEEGYGVGGADGSPSGDGIAVVRNGTETQTWYSNFTEPGQEPRYVYDLSARVGSTNVDVSLNVFPGVVVSSNYVQAGVEFPEEYLEDYEPDPEQGAFEYFPDLIPRE